MTIKPTYKELEQRVNKLEKIAVRQKQTDVMLEEYKMFFSQTNDLVYICDNDGNIQFINKIFEKMTNHKVEDFKGSSFARLFEGEDLKTMTDAYIRTLKGERPEYKIRFKDTGVLCEHRNFPTQDKKGNIVGVASIARNITERKHVEVALHQYEHIVSSSTDMLALLDKRFKYIAANNAYTEAFKLTHEQLIGNSVAKVFGEKFFKTVIKPNADRCMSGEKVNYQDWFVFPATGQCYMDITYYPYYDKDSKKIAGFVVNGRNITDRRLAEETLLENENKYRTLFEMESDAIALIEVETGNMLDINRAFTELYGYSKEEILRMKNIDFSAESEKTKRATRKHDQYIPLRYHKKNDGTVFPAEIKATIFQYQGKNVHLAAIRDITNRKLIQDRLEQSKNDLEMKAGDLEELNAALNVLLKKRVEDRKELEKGILANVRTLIEPYIAKLKNSKLPHNQKMFLDILESNLNEILSPFSHRLSSKFLNLSPSEIQIADLVKHGKTNKEIAEISCVAKRTIEFHRENIRKKLGLTNKKTNLKTYLMSIT